MMGVATSADAIVVDDDAEVHHDPKSTLVHTTSHAMSAADVLSAKGKSVPCGTPASSSSSSSSSARWLHSFPRLAEVEQDEGPRRLRKRRWRDASQAFVASFETALSKLYAPAIADLTEYFVALEQAATSHTSTYDASLWLPGSSAAETSTSYPARIPTALLYHSSAQSPAFYSQLDRSLANHALQVVRVAGEECINYRATLQLLTRRLIEVARIDNGTMQGPEPESLLELGELMRQQPSSIRRLPIVHFPAVEDFPTRLLSDVILAISQARLSIAILMGVGSRDAAEQAMRSTETQSALEISRFAITSGGPEEVFGRVISQIFLDPVRPPPLYLNSATYDALHEQFFNNHNDIEAIFDAIQLAVLHHYHSRGLAAFASLPHGPLQHVEPGLQSGWRSSFVHKVRSILLRPFVDLDTDLLDDNEVALKPDSVETVPDSISVSDSLALDEEDDVSTETHQTSHLVKMATHDAYLLSQAPSFRSHIDSYMAWQARALVWFCCIQKLLSEVAHGKEPQMFSSSETWRYARQATYSQIADKAHNYYQFALAGTIGDLFRKTQSRMGALEPRAMGVLVELMLRLVKRDLDTFEDAYGPPEADDALSLSYQREHAALEELQDQVSSWGERVEGWRQAEELARSQAAQHKARMEVKLNAELAALDEDDADDANAELSLSGRTEDGKVATSIDGPLLFQRKAGRAEKRRQIQATLSALDQDEKARQLRSEEEYKVIRREVVGEIYALLCLRCPSAIKGGPKFEVPFQEIWLCSSATYLSEHLDPCPRFQLITHLDNPFPVMSRYGLDNVLSAAADATAAAAAPTSANAPPKEAVPHIKTVKDLERLGALPDVCRAFRLYRESSERAINLHDWYVAFAQGVKADRAVLDLGPLVALGNAEAEMEAARRGGGGGGGGGGRTKRKRRRGRGRGRDELGGEDDEVESDDEDVDEADRHKRSHRPTTTPSARSSSQMSRDMEVPASSAGSQSTSVAQPNQEAGLNTAPDVAGDGPDEEQHDIQARFALAVDELAMLGLLKGTRRRVEHTMKLIWDLPQAASA